MTKLEKGKAMQCFGKLVVNVELDPDPQTQDKLMEEFNCKNCGSYQYCQQLSDTLS